MAACCHKQSSRTDWQVNGRRRAVCCTDIPWLVIFVVFWSVMVGVACYAFVCGNPWRLIYGSDCYGNVCGSLNRRIPMRDPELLAYSGLDLRGKPLLLYYYPMYPKLSRSVCVERCPDEHLSTVEAFSAYRNSSGLNLCDYGLDYEERLKHQSESLFGAAGRCVALPVEPQRALFHRCLPARVYDAYRRRSLDAYSAVTTQNSYGMVGGSESGSNATMEALKAEDVTLKTLRNIFGFFNVANSVFQQVLADVYTEWRDLLLICLAVVLASCALLLTVLYAPRIFIGVCVTFGAVGSLALVGFLWFTFVAINTAINAKQAARIPLLRTEIRNELAFLAFACAGSLIALVLIAALIALRKRFSAVAHLFAEASCVVRALPVLLLQPFASVLVLLLFMGGWLVVLAFVVTVDKPAIDIEMLNYSRAMGVNVSACIVYRDTTFSKVASALLVVALIWACEFVLAAQQFCVANAVARWYFTREKPPGRLCAAGQYRPVMNAVRMLVVHHVGTLALGSLLIPLCRFPRMLILACAKRLGHPQARSGVSAPPPTGQEDSGCCMPCCATTCKPCFWLSESCLKFINTSAYALVATRGFALCEASRASYRLLATNVQRVAAATSVSDFIMFLAKLGCATAAASVAVALLNSREIHFYALFVLVTAVYAFFIAHCFLCVYECAVDVLMLCYCEDCEVNDGTYGHEYYSSSKLMDVVKQTARRLNKLTKRHRNDVPILRTQPSETGQSAIISDPSVSGCGTGITTLTPDCSALSATGGPFAQQQVATIAELSRMLAPETPDIVAISQSSAGQLVLNDKTVDAACEQQGTAAPFALPNAIRI